MDCNMDTCSFLIYFEEERLELKFWFERKRFKSRRIAVERKDDKDSPNIIQLLKRIERKESEIIAMSLTGLSC